MGRWWNRTKNKLSGSYGNLFILMMLGIVGIPIATFFIYLTFTMVAFGPETSAILKETVPLLIQVMMYGFIFITAILFFIIIPLGIYKSLKNKRLI